MALQKSFEKFGITFENGYHKITAVNWYMIENVCQVIIESYQNEASASEPTNSLEIKSYNFTDFIEPKGSQVNAISVAYRKVKEQEEWLDAIDV